MSKRESGFISIGTCEVCGATAMELFHSREGLACVTCNQTVMVDQPRQARTAARYEREIQKIRNRLEGHGGH